MQHFRLTVHFNRHQSVTLYRKFTQHFETKFNSGLSSQTLTKRPKNLYTSSILLFSHAHGTVVVLSHRCTHIRGGHCDHCGCTHALTQCFDINLH